MSNRATKADVLVLVVMMTVMALPHLLRLFGVQAGTLENRDLAVRPTFQWSKVLSASYYESWSRYVEDWNSLRRFAVMAQSRLRFTVFDAVASAPQIPKLVVGKSGWLFIQKSITQPCWKPEQLRAGTEALRSIETALTGAGKRFLFTVSPNKASIYPDFLSGALRLDMSCALESRDRLQTLISDVGPKGYLDAFKLLREARGRETRPLYSPLDTHWTEFGSAQFVSDVVVRLGIQPSELGSLTKMREERRQPDLSRLSGLFYEEVADIYRFERGGKITHVDAEEIEHAGQGRPYVRRRATNAGVALDKRRVLVLHDSFVYCSWDQLGDFFEEVQYVHWTAFDPAKLGLLARQFDVVIIQTVEREAFERISTLKYEDALAFSRELKIDGGH